VRSAEVPRWCRYRDLAGDLVARRDGTEARIGTCPCPTGEDGRQGVQLVVAATASHDRQGATVDLRDSGDEYVVALPNQKV
jgi:hypothetical protein